MREALTIGEILAVSYRVGKAALVKMRGMIALFTFLIFIFIVVSTLEDNYEALLADYQTAFKIFYLIITGVLLLVDLAIFYQINSIIRHQDATVRESIAAISKRPLNIIGALIVCGVIAFSIDYVFAKLIIPGLFLSLVLAFYFPMIIFEEENFFIEVFVKSIKYSWEKIVQNLLLFYIILPIVGSLIAFVLLVVILLFIAIIGITGILLFKIGTLEHPLLFQGVILITTALMSAVLLISYNIMISVQIYNVKISLGEELPESISL